MINLKFTSNCPFCNKQLIECEGAYYYCHVCSYNKNRDITFQYDYITETMTALQLEFYKHKLYNYMYDIKFTKNQILYTDYKNRNNNCLILDHIPDFDKLQDLISMIESMMLFK